MVPIRPFGPIRSIYLFDFQTGQCKTWHPNRMKQIICLDATEAGPRRVVSHDPSFYLLFYLFYLFFAFCPSHALKDCWMFPLAQPSTRTVTPRHRCCGRGRGLLYARTPFWCVRKPPPTRL